MPEPFEIIDPLERFVEARGIGTATGGPQERPYKAIWLAGAAIFAISTLILVNTLSPRIGGEFASGGQAFADCVPSHDTPASVIEYFQKLNEPLPERFCASEDAAPEASDEPPAPEPPQAYENAPSRSRYAQRQPEPAAQESAHAIVPDAPQVAAPTTEAPTPQATAPTTEVPTPQAGEPSAEAPTPQATAPSTEVPTPHAGEPSAEEPSPQSPAPNETPSLASGEQPGPQSPNDQSPTIVKDQLVTITSAAIIRDGPSSSAQIIGRAHTGAMARVAAIDSGWAQVVDPASGNKGWVESSILAPTTAATEEVPDVAPQDTWPEDQRAATSENRTAASKSKHSAEAKRHRGKHHHGRRRFFFRFAIRGL
jgi:SH3 domain-containing protein